MQHAGKSSRWVSHALGSKNVLLDDPIAQHAAVSMVEEVLAARLNPAIALADAAAIGMWGSHGWHLWRLFLIMIIYGAL